METTPRLERDAVATLYHESRRYERLQNMQIAHTNNGVADFLRQLRIHGGGDKAMSSALGITGGGRRGGVDVDVKSSRE